MIIQPTTVDNAFLAWDTLFRQVLADTPTRWQQVASEMKSTTSSSVHAWMDRIPGLRQWLGERVINNLASRFQTVLNQKWEDTIGVEREKIEDDQLGIYTPMVQELARASKIWPDRLVFALLLLGGSTKVYDNQNFFDPAHPINMDDPSSATQSNLVTGVPLTGISAGDSMATAIANFKTLKAPDGVEYEADANLVVVPPQLEFVARKVLQAEVIAQAGLTSGAAGVTNVFKGLADLLVVPRLSSDPTSWYIMCTNRAIKPLIFQNRLEPEFQYLNKPNDPNVFLQDKYLMGVRVRGAAAFGPWFLAQKNTP